MLDVLKLLDVLKVIHIKCIFVKNFMHLGKQYRLKIYEFEFEGVKLNANYINVFVKNKNNTQKKKRLLESWYRENAFQTFSEIMDEN